MTQRGHREPRGHGDIARAQGSQGAVVTLQKKGEHCDTAGTPGIKETLGTLWGPMEPRGQGAGVAGLASRGLLDRSG